MSHDIEMWKPLARDPRYSVSSYGRVRGPKGGILRGGRGSHGYQSVSLGHGKPWNIHVLVAETFLGPKPKGQQVRHKDGTKDNNRADNLEYGTAHENIMDAVRLGTYLSPRRLAHCKIMVKRYRWDKRERKYEQAELGLQPR